jgi:hypothetical protein
MPDVKQLLRKAVLRQLKVIITLQNGDQLRGLPKRDQSLRFSSSDSILSLRLIPDGKESPGKTESVPISDITEVELKD